jgi:hypothetical protein
MMFEKAVEASPQFGPLEACEWIAIYPRVRSYQSPLTITPIIFYLDKEKINILP